MICQWCFEEEAIQGKTVCQACVDAINRESEESKDFDLDKWLEEDSSMRYKVYVIDSDAYYHGKALVAAESADEANKFIDDFVHNDPHNHGDSWGYCHVDESDTVEDVYAERKGILYYGIHYGG